MPIASQEILELTPHTGRFRARFRYTFDDGREALQGPIFVADSSDANTKLVDMAPSVLTQVQEFDADEAVNLDQTGQANEATEARVRFQYIKRAFAADEPYKTYMKLKKVAPALIALGYTNEQYASYLGASVSMVVKFKQRWQELNANSEIYEAYVGVL